MFICRIGSENHRKDTNSQTWLANAIIGETKNFNLFLLFLLDMLVFSFQFLWFFFFFLFTNSMFTLSSLFVDCALSISNMVSSFHNKRRCKIYISKAQPGLSVKNIFLLVILLAHLWSPTTMISSQEVWCQCTTTGL